MTCGGLGNQVSRMRTMMIVLYKLLQNPLHDESFTSLHGAAFSRFA